jgi:hypothetical protein
MPRFYVFVASSIILLIMWAIFALNQPNLFWLQKRLGSSILGSGQFRPGLPRNTKTTFGWFFRSWSLLCFNKLTPNRLIWSSDSEQQSIQSMI